MDFWLGLFLFIVFYIVILFFVYISGIFITFDYNFNHWQMFNSPEKIRIFLFIIAFIVTGGILNASNNEKF